MAILQLALGRLAAHFPAAHATLQLGGTLYAAAGACRVEAVLPPPPWQRVPVVNRVSVVALPGQGEVAHSQRLILAPLTRAPARKHGRFAPKVHCDVRSDDEADTESLGFPDSPSKWCNIRRKSFTKFYL